MIDDEGHDLRFGVRDAGADTIRERSGAPCVLRKQILGGCFRFESASAPLLDLVETAYGDPPRHRLPAATSEFHVELRLLPRQVAPGAVDTPPRWMQSDAGLLCSVLDTSNYAVLAPGPHHALVVASEDMLSHPYHLRYELLEFAVFTLATRGLGLIPLRGACVGRSWRGVLLLLGASGAGKSALALHGLLEGLDFLAEDVVFVQPENLLATGVVNYLHVRPDALRFIDDAATRRWIGGAPGVRRHSGVENFEADLRSGPGWLAPGPLELASVVFVSSRSAEDPATLLSPVPEGEIAARLATDQPYAAQQPDWHRFERQVLRLGIHQSRRDQRPRASVNVLRQLLV